MMCTISGAARPPTEHVAVVWSRRLQSVEWDCVDGTGGTRNTSTADADYTGATEGYVLRTSRHTTSGTQVMIHYFSINRTNYNVVY